MQQQKLPIITNYRDFSLFLSLTLVMNTTVVWLLPKRVWCTLLTQNILSYYENYIKEGRGPVDSFIFYSKKLFLTYFNVL